MYSNISPNDESEYNSSQSGYGKIFSDDYQRSVPPGHKKAQQTPWIILILIVLVGVGVLLAMKVKEKYDKKGSGVNVYYERGFVDIKNNTSSSVWSGFILCNIVIFVVFFIALMRRRNKRRSVIISSKSSDQLRYSVAIRYENLILGTQYDDFSDRKQLAETAAKKGTLNDEYKQKLIEDLKHVIPLIESDLVVIQKYTDNEKENASIANYTKHLKFLKDTLNIVENLEATNEEEMKERKDTSLEVLKNTTKIVLAKFNPDAYMMVYNSKQRTEALMNFVVLLQLYGEGITAGIDTTAIPEELKNAIVKFDYLYDNGVFDNLGVKDPETLKKSIKDAINSIKTSKK